MLRVKRDVKVASLNMAFQPPRELEAQTVRTYVEAIQAGTAIEPLLVYCDGSTEWLGDGFHRVAAAKIVGVETLVAEIRPGTIEDMRALVTRSRDAP